MLTHLVKTQGRVGGLQPRRHKNSKRKQGQDHQDLERTDGSVRIDVDRALRSVRFFFFIQFCLIFFSCRVVSRADSSHQNAGSTRWGSALSCFAVRRVSACRRPGTQICEIFFFQFFLIFFSCRIVSRADSSHRNAGSRRWFTAQTAQK